MENTWKKIYQLAGEIYRLKPWTTLEETDIFGVEIPGTGTQYFISIMGSEGVVESVAAYEGAEALAGFWLMQQSETPDGADLLTLPHLILTYENEKDIDPEQLKRFRSLGKVPSLNGSFPEIRYNKPGIYPGEPGGEKLNELVIILKQTIDVTVRAFDDPDLVMPDENDMDTYLVRKQDPGNKEWMDHYLSISVPPVQYNFTTSQEQLSEINALPLTNAVMQIHSQLMPMQVIENGITYFAYIVILVNKKSGRIEFFETLIAKPDFQTMMEKVPNVCLKLIGSLGFRPRALEVKSELMYGMLEESMRQCGIKLNRYKELPALNDAINGIIEYNRRQR